IALSSFYFLLLPPPRLFPLFPYTTLFRSWRLDRLHFAEPVDFLAAERVSESLSGSRPARISSARSRRKPPTARLMRPAQKQKTRSEEHTSELQSLTNLVCRLLLEKKNNNT